MRPQNTSYLLNQTLFYKVLIKLNFQAGGGAGASRSMVDYVNLFKELFHLRNGLLNSCSLYWTDIDSIFLTTLTFGPIREEHWKFNVKLLS